MLYDHSHNLMDGEIRYYLIIYYHNYHCMNTQLLNTGVFYCIITKEKQKCDRLIGSIYYTV